MLGYVTIEVHGADMEGASRHARRLADNFLEDLDTMQRASRARDRRAMSHLETGVDEPVSRVIHSTPGRRTPLRSTRLGSVPPTTVGTTYRPVYYASEVGLPPAVPGRTYYRTNRYFTETPYYLSSYSTRTAEPSRPILTTHYSSSPAPITQRYTYYYPSVMTGKLHTPYRVGSYTSLTPEVEHERRRIGRRMDDDLLEYKLPPPEYYRDMRGSLRSIHDKLDAHRRLLDRYSGIDMQAAPSSVEDRIESKYQQLANRMGRSFTVRDSDAPRSHGPAVETSPIETDLYYQSPQTTQGYGQGLVKPEGSQVSELRGRIKRLLCRSRKDPHYYRFLP